MACLKLRRQFTELKCVVFIFPCLNYNSLRFCPKRQVLAPFHLAGCRSFTEPDLSTPLYNSNILWWERLNNGAKLYKFFNAITILKKKG